MGQYHIPVNLDKKEFIHPHRLGCGLKQWEQLVNTPGTAQALFILLCVSNERGGGDLRGHEVLGRWAGDALAVVGDYGEKHDLPSVYEADKIYDKCLDEEGGWTDISSMVAEVIEAEFEGKYSGSGWRTFRGRFADKGVA